MTQMNPMSIKHLLCSSNDLDGEIKFNHYIPSPVISYHSNSSSDDDDDDGESYDTEDIQVKSPQQPIFYNHHRRAYSDNNIHSTSRLYELHCRAILPYRRRRSHSSGEMNSQIRVPWTPAEDMLLQQGYEQGLSWAMIAATYLPHRSRGCCWGRFKTLKNKKFLTVRRQIRAKSKPWKTLNPMDMKRTL
ncbi:uncharacterized protein BX664DRAFT_343967 [Halteromyces radiatus]|uniref:uncharacterized protein n=1 Tax=Halteromyces radiatus TaxID=101107 RepID=UPI002220C454|nr:uncharacterized protein BX664DRAFT_343967 [Halteromyces radiatus]KAI8076805.1 hypothetical protein BX664DRAFT_343967 [Halteromyces radiatus]